MHHRLLLSIVCLSGCLSGITGCFVGDAICRTNPVTIGCQEGEVQVDSCDAATRPCREVEDCDSFALTFCEELPLCVDVDNDEPCYDDGSEQRSSG